MNNAHGWWTYNVPGLSYGETRSVQFIDAIRQLDPHLNLGDIQAEAKGVVKKTIVEKAVGLSDPGGRLVTRLDCGWRKEKVGLFHDGEHHLTRKQHDYDAEVTLILHDLGWESMRVTSALLQNPTALPTTYCPASHSSGILIERELPPPTPRSTKLTPLWSSRTRVSRQGTLS
mgnify:CR=1 FL=1